MAIITELAEAAFQLLADVLAVGPRKPATPTTDPAPVRPLTPRQRELAAAIQQQRGVTAEVAADLVRWLSTQDPRFDV